MTEQDEFTVHLDQVFQGPLDLLLHLVREQEVEIHDIEIHRVITGYFSYLDQLKDLDIEVAGEFLVMAATLMAVKARSLLPRDDVELDDELDPEDELIQRLIEYRRFKESADHLEERFERRRDEFPRGHHAEVADHETEITLDLGELTAWDLLGQFSRLMRETLANRPHHIRGDTHPLRWYVKTLGTLIHDARDLTLRSLLEHIEEEPSREAMIGAFCALLELMKLGVVSARQEDSDGEIHVTLREGADMDLDHLIGASRFLDEEDDEEDQGEKDPPGSDVSASPEETETSEEPKNEAEQPSTDA